MTLYETETVELDPHGHEDNDRPKHLELGPSDMLLDSEQRTPTRHVVVVARPCCSAPTSSGAPCSRVVSKAGERCHQHGD